MGRLYQNIQILAFLLLFILAGAGYSQSSKTLKIGVYNNPPKIYLDSQGHPEGIFIDILEEISEKEDFDIQFVSGEWNELKDKLLHREIDILPDFAFSEERDSLYTLNAVPVLTSWLEVFSLKEQRINSIKELEGKTIGALEGSIQEGLLKDDLQQDFSITYNLKTYKDYPGSISALKRGEIDLLVASRFFAFSEHNNEKITSTGIVFRPSELHLAFSKDEDPDLVHLFDRNLAQMKNDPDSNFYKILQIHLDSDLSTTPPTRFLWLLALLLTILLVVLIFTFLLKYQVDLKTKALWRRNRQLTRAKEKAEENERLKTIFLQNMSHEIRTPMNGIIGFLSLLKEPDLDKESREKYIDLVNKSGKRLLTTINNIIEISKIDSRQLEVNTSTVDLLEVMNFYYNFFLPQAKEKNLEFRFNCDIPQDKAYIVSDKFILDNILTNLLNNALKFTSKGTVEFGASLQNREIHFYVQDSGVGIPVERQKAIFERFVQANLDMTRAHEGSGLGLAIVKAYVEVLNGRLSFDSNEGEGSTFHVFLPYIPAEVVKPEEPEFSPEQFRGEHLKILVAEDDNISFLFLQQVLNLPEITTLRATDGQQAIEIARNNPDLSMILMDIKMPKINGIEATKNIRSFNPTVPIIAQSAYTFSGEQEQALEAGCNDYITKPVSRSRLISILTKYTHA